MSFFGNLYNVGNMIVKGGLKRLLLGAGVGLTSGAVILVIFNYYLTMMVSSFDALDADYIGLLGLMGVDKAVSIVVGAYAVRLTLLSARLSLRKRGSDE